MTLFFMPYFNNFTMLSFLGDSFRSPSVFFSILFLIVSLCSLNLNTKMHRNINIFYLFVVLLMISSAFINIENNSNINSGSFLWLEKSINKFMTLASLSIFSFCVYLYFSNVASFKILINSVLISSFIMFCYVGFEISSLIIPIIIYEMPLAAYTMVEGLIHLRQNDWGARSRGFAFEPSYQVMVLIFIMPFLMQLNNKRNFMLIAWAICVVSTFSPIALISAFVFILFYKFKFIKGLWILIACISLFFLVKFLFAIDLGTLRENSFNTRVGTLESVIYGIRDNPFFGVGPGMGGYWISHYYSDLFLKSQEFDTWNNEAVNNFNAPIFSSVLFFIFDFGFVVFIFIICFMWFSGSIKYIINRPLARATFLSMLVASFGLSTYTWIGFWFYIPLFLFKLWDKLFGGFKHEVQL
jgi:hypothetical protein